jgi:hypothetical protein
MTGQRTSLLAELERIWKGHASGNPSDMKNIEELIRLDPSSRGVLQNFMQAEAEGVERQALISYVHMLDDSDVARWTALLTPTGKGGTPARPKTPSEGE